MSHQQQTSQQAGQHPLSSDTGTSDRPPSTLVETLEHRRFAEFCDACRRYGYIGLCFGSPGVGKSHAAKALALLAVQRGYTVIYREAHVLIDDIHQARELGEIKKYRATLKAADLVVIDDLFLRKLPPSAGDELADVIMSRYEKSSTLITSNREIEDWGKLLGDVVIVAPLLDRLMHHGNLLKFVGKSWRLKESAERLAKARQTA